MARDVPRRMWPRLFVSLLLSTCRAHVAQLSYTLPGAMGTPTYVENPTPQQSSAIQAGYETHAFNKFVSDRLGVNRSLPDYRSAWCQRSNLYTKHLLPSSVIVTFHNEALSTLLRTVHSILHRCPPSLLTEILLVDDSSTLEELGSPLEKKIRNLSKVRLIRSVTREGVIGARMKGAEEALGKVLTFLDSHVEVTQGWLEPILDRITHNESTIVSPLVHTIDPNTLEFKSHNSTSTLIGFFSWSLNVRWRQAPDDMLRSLRSPVEPLPTPVLGSGMFSIHRQFFWKLGGFDPSLRLWGAENLEMSFKTWMCGGRVEISVCSHIGHIRKIKTNFEEHLSRNRLRVAAVWMDEYAQHVWASMPDKIANGWGDVQDRVNLRRKLECRSFDWFMSHVAGHQFNPKNALAYGEIRSLAFGAYLCLDSPPTWSSNHNRVSIWPCHSGGGNQHWYITSNSEVRREELCLDYTGTELVMYPCHGMGGNQRWHFHQESGFFVHLVSRKCLSLEARDKVWVSECEDRVTLRWQIEHFNPSQNAPLLLDNKGSQEL